MSDVRRGYRGTVWDWTVIPFIAGLFLIGIGVSGGYPASTVIGVVVAVLSAVWWWRRRQAPGRVS